MIDAMNKRYHKHIIITLEDPIEYLCFTRISAPIELQAKVGSDVPSFGSGLEHACCVEDPDIILVGEMLRPGNDFSGDHSG